MAKSILIVLLIGGGIYFAYWATRRTLNPPKKHSRGGRRVHK